MDGARAPTSSGATGATLNLATAGNGDRGDLIGVRVTVNDGTVTSAPVTSARRDRRQQRRRSSARTCSISSDTVGDTVNLDADATDADGDTLTYSATGLPAGVTIAPATGVISGTLAGTRRAPTTSSSPSATAP